MFNSFSKLVALLIFYLSIQFTHGLSDYLLNIAILLTFVLLGQMKLKELLKLIVSAVYFGLFIALFTISSFKTGDLLFEFAFIQIYSSGVVNAMLIIYRIILMIVGTKLYFNTTDDYHFTRALEKLISPLKILNVKVEKFVMIFTVALKFIPILVTEFNKIIIAQAARGADIRKVNLFKKIKLIIPIIVPLLKSSFKKADDLAIAMDIRKYDSSTERTIVETIQNVNADYYLMFTAVVQFFVIILL